MNVRPRAVRWRLPMARTGVAIWNRLSATAKVVAAVIATLAALAAVVATAFELAGRSGKTIVIAPQTNATPNAGQQVEHCMRRHHLRAARVSLGNPNVSRVL